MENIGHIICHFEIAANSVGRSGSFYKEVFGWKIVYDLKNPNYATFDPGSGVGGGIVQSKNIIPPHTVAYVLTNNIAETLKKVVEKGGKIVLEKTQLGPDNRGGWFAFFSDLDGNLIGLFEPKI
jgi:predicted enzyme related to lactoylglutathione lyase